MNDSDVKQNKQANRPDSDNMKQDQVPRQYDLDAKQSKQDKVPGQPDSDVKGNKVPGQHDIIVVVGDEEFTASSHFLCSYSQKFRAADIGGSKEAETGRFEFPDRDPNENGTLSCRC